MRYFAIACCLLALSSCIKIEEESLCDSPPMQPALSQATYEVEQGDSLKVKILSPEPGVNYTWRSPKGYDFTGTALNYYNNSNEWMIGEWSVYGVKDGCKSTTKTFDVNISVNAPDCGMTNNTFQLGTGAKKQYSYNYTDDYYNDYKMFFNDTYGAAYLFLHFKQKPATGVYDITDYYYGYNECAIVYDPSGYGAYNYTASSGKVYVSVSGSTTTISFCAVKLTVGGTTYNCNGKFVVNN